MKKSKWVILSIILILILIVGFISIYLWKKSDSSYEIEKVTEIKEKADEQKEYSTSALMDDYILDYSKIIWMLRQKEE